MAGWLLQNMVEDLSYESLPANWSCFDIVSFSAGKELWDYQQQALRNAVKVLWRYYEDFANYHQGEPAAAVTERKRALVQWYIDNGMDRDLSIELSSVRRDISQLLRAYYPTRDDKVEFEQLVNRMSFWMATGSGKTLVLVKLIELLWQLADSGEIPSHDFLVLTYRDDLIEQLKEHVAEYNAAHMGARIRLYELREYASVRRENPSLFRNGELTVFYYRSDNLSDEQQEKRVDFRSYDNEGRWYVFLDEAHKGGREESKRQQIYSILSRNGFLFNFSATFTDAQDFVTTVFNFNLARYITDGYGKHITVLKQEIRAFRDEEDYTQEEKQKVVVKSLLLLAYARKFYERIRNIREDLYHRPLLMTLAHEVNTEDAELKLFFRQLAKVAAGETNKATWTAARDELWEELREHPEYLFENDSGLEIDHQDFYSIGPEEVLELVFNAGSPGDIEVLRTPLNKKEMAFKLKTSDRPFALTKIGDISEWLKNELAEYEIGERVEDEGYFESLDEEHSEINILMGSRGFYEGWDSNRPNVINFINIGMGTSAKKFVLQSVGRGVRIEPVADKRKRLVPLYNAGDVDDDLFRAVKDNVGSLETVFIFATNRNALHFVIQGLEEDTREGHELSLSVNEEAKGKMLLVPTYRRAERPMVEDRQLAKFELVDEEVKLLCKYVEYINDDRVMVARYDASPQQMRVLKRCIEQPGGFFKSGDRKFGNLDLMIERVLSYFAVVPEEVDSIKDLEDEIRHFRHVRVTLENIEELQDAVETVSEYPRLRQELKTQYEQLSMEEYTEWARRLSDAEQLLLDGKQVEIRYIEPHYYVPVILGKAGRIEFLKHVIKTPSEVEFVEALTRHLDGKNVLAEFDWWMFSKLDESLDRVFIPYYNPSSNAVSHFSPDFVFWLKKRNDYFIVFVDPKGTKHTEYQWKVDGYKRIFENDDGDARIFEHEGQRVRVVLRLYTDDVEQLAEEAYKDYWFDVGQFDEVWREILEEANSED